MTGHQDETLIPIKLMENTGRLGKRTSDPTEKKIKKKFVGKKKKTCLGRGGAGRHGAPGAWRGDKGGTTITARLRGEVRRGTRRKGILHQGATPIKTGT